MDMLCRFLGNFLAKRFPLVALADEETSPTHLYQISNGQKETGPFDNEDEIPVAIERLIREVHRLTRSSSPQRPLSADDLFEGYGLPYQ